MLCSTSFKIAWWSSYSIIDNHMYRNVSPSSWQHLSWQCLFLQNISCNHIILQFLAEAMKNHDLPNSPRLIVLWYVCINTGSDFRHRLQELSSIVLCLSVFCSALFVSPYSNSSLGPTCVPNQVKFSSYFSPDSRLFVATWLVSTIKRPMQSFVRHITTIPYTHNSSPASMYSMFSYTSFCNVSNTFQID